jgi:putative peptidoglycan lipid II flippase
MVALRNWSGIRHTLVTYARLILMITLPVTIILVYFSEPIVAFLFQRGAFSESDTHVVGRVQALFLLQVPIYIAGIMLVRLVSSLKANRLLMWGAVLNLSLNIIFNYIFMKSFAVEGIALATSLMYLVSCCYLLFVSLRLLKKTSQ